MEFAVSRDGTTHVTLHGGSDTTACDEATDQVAASLESLGDDVVAEWELDGAEVYEHPTAPFDPYTITVAFAVTVTVEADDADDAADRGAELIDEALEAADVGTVTYTSAPTAAAA
ncbi:hypothetical protein [Natronolimnohabitans innermongolicus]|uniref:Uncharacterized protein n=1 Tax=Natronolimnohabitans innermongolicus JCM 12255 TaxID=1227499 RepID=L9XE73_9EURY|nr:hypothetical protein [Natronolimnohabitans innermongolicus]ELY58938.1 hypothetical protein C493_05815 [Natronolimnohabitans innermongolicus JCM 12255]